MSRTVDYPRQKNAKALFDLMSFDFCGNIGIVMLGFDGDNVNMELSCLVSRLQFLVAGERYGKYFLGRH